MYIIKINIIGIELSDLQCVLTKFYTFRIEQITSQPLPKFSGLTTSQTKDGYC